jgi:hypothetical protein
MGYSQPPAVLAAMSGGKPLIEGNQGTGEATDRPSSVGDVECFYQPPARD